MVLKSHIAIFSTTIYKIEVPLEPKPKILALKLQWLKDKNKKNKNLCCIHINKNILIFSFLLSFLRSLPLYLIFPPLFFLKIFLSCFSNFSTLCEGLFFCRVGVGVVGHWRGSYCGCGWSGSWVWWVGHVVGFVWFLADLGLLGVRVPFFLHLILFKYHLFIFKHH